MISAADLRKKMSDIVMKTMIDIEVAVKSAAENGSTSTSVAIREGFDYAPIVKELSSLGYQAKVKSYAGDYRDPGYRAIEISW